MAVTAAIHLLGTSTMAISDGKKTIIKGEISDTKDGVYVGQVLVPEEVWPVGKNLRKLTGKLVEITGVVETNAKTAPTSIPSEPMIQQRTGPYKYMTRIDSVKIK